MFNVSKRPVKLGVAKAREEFHAKKSVMIHDIPVSYVTGKGDLRELLGGDEAVLFVDSLWRDDGALTVRAIEGLSVNRKPDGLKVGFYSALQPEKEAFVLKSAKVRFITATLMPKEAVKIEFKVQSKLTDKQLAIVYGETREFQMEVVTEQIDLFADKAKSDGKTETKPTSAKPAKTEKVVEAEIGPKFKAEVEKAKARAPKRPPPPKKTNSSYPARRR